MDYRIYHKVLLALSFKLTEGRREGREAYTKALASHRPKVYPLGNPLGLVL